MDVVSTWTFSLEQSLHTFKCPIYRGYNLGQANLNSVLKYGDEFVVEYKIQPKKDDSEYSDDLLIVKTAWIGPRTQKPIRPCSDPQFSMYLSNRGMDETGFLNWLYGLSPLKPYFPFVSDLYEGVVTSFVRDSSSDKVNGVLLCLLKKKMKISSDGKCLKVDEQQDNNADLVASSKTAAMHEDVVVPYYLHPDCCMGTQSG